MKRKIRFIVNRFSGLSSKENIEAVIHKYLDLQQFDFEVKYTEWAGHATKLSREAVQRNYDIVASVGGDGTLNEIASEVLFSNTSLAVIPGGSGNGFAMHIGMGRKIEDAIALLNTSEEIIIDSGIVNKHFFINLCGIGLDGIIAQKIKHNPYRGLKLYISQLFFTLTNFKAYSFGISIDGKTFENEYLNLIVANASMYGYNARIAPKAKLMDGKFDIVLIKKASIIRYMFSAWRLFNKSFHKANFVENIRGTEISIKSLNDNIDFHIDGEGFQGESEYSFRLQPNSIKLIIPKGKTIN